MSDRIPCLVPGCRRTAPRKKFPDAVELICGKHFRMLPKAVRDRRRDLKRRARRLERYMDREVAKGRMTEGGRRVLQEAMERDLDAIWEKMRAYFLAPEKPVGLESVLEELGLA